MKEIKNAKTIEAILEQYSRSTYTDLGECYSRASEAKYNAMQRCRRLMVELDGWGIRILSYNVYSFTVGFYFNDKETDSKCFAYITKDSDRFFRL